MTFFDKLNTPQGMGLMNAAAALLQASGPSPTRTSLGQAIGMAIPAYQQGRQTALQEQINQMKAGRGGIGAINPGLYTPESVQAFQAGGQKDFGVLVPRPTAAPSAVQEFEAFSKLTPEQQQQFMNIKRGGFTLEGQRFDPMGNVQVGIDTTAKTGAQLEGAKTIAKEQAKTKAAAIEDLPRVEGNAQSALDVIGKLRAHKGRELATGASAKFIPDIPGSPIRDFNTLLDQAKGKVFLEAYEGLKGGGQITEVEGQKAEQAIARLEQSQSEGAFLEALDDLEGVITRGVSRARKKAGVQAAPSGTTSTGLSWSIEQ